MPAANMRLETRIEELPLGAWSQGALKRISMLREERALLGLRRRDQLVVAPKLVVGPKTGINDQSSRRAIVEKGEYDEQPSTKRRNDLHAHYVHITGIASATAFNCGWVKAFCRPPPPWGIHPPAPKAPKEKLLFL